MANKELEQANQAGSVGAEGDGRGVVEAVGYGV